MEPGDTLTVTAQNTFLSQLGTISAAVGQDNLRHQAVGIPHLTLTTGTNNPILAYSNGMEYSGATYTETSAAYVVVDAAADPAELTSMSTALVAGDVVRLHARVLTGLPDRIDLANDEYLFRFYINIGAGAVAVGPEFVYSMGGCNTDNDGTDSDDEIDFQSHLMSYTYIHTGANATLSSVHLYTKVYDAQNSFEIKHYSLRCMVFKH